MQALFNNTYMVIPRLFVYATKQIAQTLSWRRLAHKGFANQISMHIMIVHQLHIRWRMNATFADCNSIATGLDDARQQVDGGLQAHFKSAQIAIIYANQRRC